MTTIHCHDCKKEITVNNTEIQGGVLLKYQNGNETIEVCKCTNCYENSSSLKDFQNCEVYSRIVGYYRPVQQWNEGKEQEYGDRKEYKNP